jgi:hypothetical protein
VRVKWRDVTTHAASIVASYDTGVTLRQLFYRLVADGTLPNLLTYYRRLSEHTAKGRRDGTFPDLLDRTSRIERFKYFTGPLDATAWLRDMYRRDRTEGQSWTVYLGVEKAGLSAQLDAWFTDPLGVPHVALGGYASQTLVDDVRRDVLAQGRPVVLIYAGDLDPTGEDIDRDFEARVGVFDEVIRVALNPEQISGLPSSLAPEVVEKLERDPRARQFVDRHGSLHQYEVDALPPTTLRDLYRGALENYWDNVAHEAVLAREDEDRARLGGAS